MNPDSLEVIGAAQLEPACADFGAGDQIQLERLGYYCIDEDTKPGALVLNRTATLRDTWAKTAKQPDAKKPGGGKSGKQKSKKNKEKNTAKG